MSRDVEDMPMTDRELTFAVTGVLVGALGIAVMLLSLFDLRHPSVPISQIESPPDLSSLLIHLIWLGGLLSIVGLWVAASLARGHDRSGGSRR